MEIFVLIAFFKYANAGGAVTHEFETKAACERAAAGLRQTFPESWVGSVHVQCYAKK